MTRERHVSPQHKVLCLVENIQVSMWSLSINESYWTKWFKLIVGFVRGVRKKESLFALGCPRVSCRLISVMAAYCLKNLKIQRALGSIFTPFVEIYTILDQRKELWAGAENISHAHTQKHKLINACALTHNKTPRVNVCRSHRTHRGRKWLDRFTDPNNWGGSDQTLSCAWHKQQWRS